MPKIIHLELSEAQRVELERVRDRDARAYMREKAAALLKIAEGQIAAQVAERGLHKTHDPDVIYRWLKEWEAQGVAGLVIKKGRGRKSAFSP
jgi:hypothetical protein